MGGGEAALPEDLAVRCSSAFEEVGVVTGSPLEAVPSGELRVSVLRFLLGLDVIPMKIQQFRAEVCFFPTFEVRLCRHRDSE